MEALAAITAAPPSIARNVIAAAVAEQFGLRGELYPLVSERDQNYRLEAPGGERYLVKVSSAVEAAATTALQVDVLRHLEDHGRVIAPRVVPARSGDACGAISDGEASLALRVLSWVPGPALESVGIDAGTAAALGAALARLDAALADYTHAGANPVLLWDLQRVGELRPLLEHIDDGGLRAAVTGAIDDFEHHVQPMRQRLPQQVIHADANPENIVLRGGHIGFIDFGDIVLAPRVFDLAIAASYLRPAGADPLTLLRPLVAAYDSVTPLDAAESGALFDLVRARLAASITLLFWRLDRRPDSDAYRKKSQRTERTASHFLEALDALGRERFTSEISQLLSRVAV